MSDPAPTDHPLDPADDHPAATDAARRPAAAAWRLSGIQIAALVVAVSFLAAAVGYVVGHRQGDADPLNAVDVGFMQDMSYHHEQAVSMSLLLLAKPDIDPSLLAFAQEIIIGQRYEQGLYTALLDRYGHPTEVGDTVMGWMGESMPATDMTGLATDAQIAALRKATGTTAEALWIALMSEHHLAGLHMADYAARHGHDRTVVNLAYATVKGQRGEVIDIARFRTNHHLPIPKGFTDPLKDQRLDPISFRDQPD